MVDWVTILTTNALAGSLFNLTDAFIDLGGVPPVMAFYRTAQPWKVNYAHHVCRIFSSARLFV